MAFLSTLPARGATRSPIAGFRLMLIFLSTLPARGATTVCLSGHTPESDFYPRSPRGERQFDLSDEEMGIYISIHAPREGSDWRQISGPTSIHQFLSTLPARGATATTRCSSWILPYFYPRSPRGERQQNPTKIQLDFAQKVQMRTSDAQNGRANFVHSV